jgi:O-antigen ligase
VISERLRTLRRWVIVFSLAAVPLAFNTDTFDVFNLTKFTLATLVALVVIGLWIVESLQSRKLLIPRTGIELPMIALLLASAITTALTFAKVVSILGFYKSYDGLISIAVFTVIGICTAEVFDTKQQIRSALYALAFAGGIPSAIYGVLQYVTFVTEGRIKLDWELWGQASFKTSAVFSTYGNPNHFAAFLAIVIPIAIVLAVTTTEPPVRWLGWGFVVLATLEVLQAQSRGAWAATGAVALALVVLFQQEVRRRPRILAAVTGAGVALFAFATIALRSRTNLLSRLVSMVAVNDTSSRQRILLWRAGLEAAMDKPIFGWGLDTFRTVFLKYQGMEFFKRYGPNQVANGPHNVFISWLFSAGLLGFAAFLWILGATFGAALRAIRICSKAEVAAEKASRRSGVTAWPFKEWRLLVGGCAVGVLSYLVSQSFNVNQIGITFLFYTLAALTAKGAKLAVEEVAIAESAMRMEEGTLTETSSLPSGLRKWLRVLRPSNSEPEGGAEATVLDGANITEQNPAKPVAESSPKARGGKGESAERSRTARANAQEKKRASKAKAAARNSHGSGASKAKTAAPRNRVAKRASPARPGTKKRIRSAETLSLWAAVAGFVYLAIFLPVAVQAVRPYRADHSYRQYQPDIESAKLAYGNAGQAREYLETTAFFIERGEPKIAEAIRRNPWESRYRYDLFELNLLRAFLLKAKADADPQNNPTAAAEQTEALAAAFEAIKEAIRLSPQEERLYLKAGELLNYWGGTKSELGSPLQPDPDKIRLAVDFLMQARQFNPWDLQVDRRLMESANALDDRALAYDAACHGWWLGEGVVTAHIAKRMAKEGFMDEAVTILRKYLSTFDLQADVAQALGEVTATAVPASSTDGQPTGAASGKAELPACIREILGTQ